MKLADYKKPRELIQTVKSDGFRLGLSTLYAPSLHRFFKENEGQWFSCCRSWVFDRTKINSQFADNLSKQLPSNMSFEPAVIVQKIKNALSTPDPECFVPSLDIQVFPIKDGGYAVLFKFDRFVLQVLQALNGIFLKQRNAWRLKVSLPMLLDELEKNAGVHRDFIYIHDTEIVLENVVSRIGGEIGIQVGSSAFKNENRIALDGEGEHSILTVMTTPMMRLQVDDFIISNAANRYGLYDYQAEGVRHLLGLSSALLADDMGLGKTRQAIVAAQLIPGPGAILVICPASLRINWEREIHAIDQEAQVCVVGDKHQWAQAQWLVINYERLGSVVQAVSDNVIKFKAMLCDEAHFLKEPDATRTRNAFLLSKYIDRRFLLTATPILNRESELHTLLKLSGHPLGNIPLSEFLENFSGVAKLRKLLSERVAEWMLRRQKNVLKSLKGKTHEVQYVTLNNYETDEYQATLNDAIAPLVKIGKLRHMLERFKSSWLIETIQSLPAENKAIIFCEFVDSVSFMQEEFGMAGIQVVTFVGEHSAKKKQRAVDTFMADPLVKVFIGTTAAAGVGLTLTAANYVFFATLPWTAAARRQAEDRAYRNGQTKPVTVITPVVPGTIDEQVIALLKYKEGIEQDLLADEQEDPTVAEKLVASGLNKNKVKLPA